MSLDLTQLGSRLRDQIYSDNGLDGQIKQYSNFAYGKGFKKDNIGKGQNLHNDSVLKWCPMIHHYKFCWETQDRDNKKPVNKI